MKRTFVILFSILFSYSLVSAFEVNIILKNGSAVKGNMLGKTADEIFLQDEKGKATTMKIEDIKALFNASNGAPIDLTAKPIQQGATNGQLITNEGGSITVEEIPGTGVYYGYLNGSMIYYYGGAWWRYGGGLWHRAFGLGGPWVIIDDSYVPYSFTYIVPDWYWPHPWYFRGHYWHGGHGWHRR